MQIKFYNLLKNSKNDFELSYETRSYLFFKSPLSRSFKSFSDQKTLTEYIPMRDCFIEPQTISLEFDPITEKRDTFFLIGIHSMQGWTTTTRHGVTTKKSTKRLKHTGNLFGKDLQLKDVC